MKYSQWPAVIKKNINTVYARLRIGLRVQPLSLSWGYERGQPLDRYYIEHFLESNSHLIKGCCLEFQEDSYTSKYGGNTVKEIDIIHIDDSNPEATIVADLTKPNSIICNRFDCIICTHVLHVVFDIHNLVSELYRILKPGGTLLIGVPHISMCEPRYNEFWRFTPLGLQSILETQFDKKNIHVKGYGNSLSAACAIRGVVSHEMRKYEINFMDDRFAVEVCATAIKA